MSFHLNNLHSLYPVTTVISGTAPGADTMGEKWAESRNIPVIKMPANWDLYGKSAGYKRNVEMAKIANYVVVFWDGISNGTRHMINIANDMKITCWIIKY